MIIREQGGQEYDERDGKSVDASSESAGPAESARCPTVFERDVGICARVDTRENTILEKTGTLRRDPREIVQAFPFRHSLSLEARLSLR